MKTIFPLFLLLLFFSCKKKECLQQGKCELSTYSSDYLQEQLVPQAIGASYYIDAEAGDDGNDGLSENTAFQSVEAVQELELQPGDHIYFKRDQMHFGSLEIRQSGTASERIVLSSYGAGALPVLKSEDAWKSRSNKQTISLFEADYITIQNLNIQGGDIAIYLRGADYVIIEGCRVGERSWQGIRATGQHSSEEGSDYGILRHSLIYSGRSGDLGDLQSTDGLQLYDGASYWEVYHNEFKAWAHSAVSVKQLYTRNEQNYNKIHDNLFTCGDIDYMRALDFTGSEGKVQYNEAYRNIIRDQSVTSHLHGNHNSMYYNLFLNIRETNATPQPQAWAIDFHVFVNNSGAEDRYKLVCHHNKAYNNLIYNCAGTAIAVLDSKTKTENNVHDNEIINNVFVNVEEGIWLEDEPEAMTIQNNLFYNEGGAVRFDAPAVTTLAEFEGYSGGAGRHSISGNLEQDPLFSDPASEDFEPRSGSPLINAGLDVGLSEDFNGQPILGLPDIGAFEGG